MKYKHSTNYFLINSSVFCFFELFAPRRKPANAHEKPSFVLTSLLLRYKTSIKFDIDIKRRSPESS